MDFYETTPTFVSYDKVKACILLYSIGDLNISNSLRVITFYI